VNEEVESMAIPATIDIVVGSVFVPVAQGLGRVLGVVIAATIALRLARLLIRRVDDNRFREQLLFFVPKVVCAAVVVTGLAAMGIDISGMVAVLATVGVAGAVVFTPVGQNLVAGAMIHIDDIYQVGEVVTVADLHGKIVYRSLLRTEMELPDGSKAWVPNSTFQENQVLNHSRLGGWRVCVQIPLDRASDRATAQRVMDEVVTSLEWNSDGKRAFVAFDHVGSEAMFFTAYAWIDDRTEEPFYRGLLLSALVDALEGVGVSVGQTTNLSLGSSRREADTLTAAADMSADVHQDDSPNSVPRPRVRAAETNRHVERADERQS
jgi:small conductance mechanosensitive channel